MTFTIYWPYEEGAKFDMEYYITSHLPLVKKLLGDVCTGISAEVGVAGMGGTPPVYLAKGYVQITSIEEFFAAYVPVSNEIAGDTANFTNITNGSAEFCEKTL